MKSESITLDTPNVRELFNNMKGIWDCEEIPGRGNRVRDVKIINNTLARDSAVQLTYKILNNEITIEDKKLIYNVSSYIMTHSHIFTDNIRYHFYNVIIETDFLSNKQLKRLEKDIDIYSITTRIICSNVKTDIDVETDTDEESDIDYSKYDDEEYINNF